MKKITSFFKQITLGMGVVAVLSSLSMAAAPGYISYQGKLTNAEGNPISAGEAPAITFKFFTDPDGGASISGADKTITPTAIENGVFSVLIEVSDSLFRDHSTVYLSATVGGQELMPRQRLVSAPYAMAVAAGSVGSNELSNSSVTALKLSPMTMPTNVIASSVAVDAVRTAQIQDGAVTGAKILDGTITSADVGSISITKITGLTLGTLAGKNTVGSGDLADGAVTMDKISSGDLVTIYKTKGDGRLISGTNYFSAVCDSDPTVKYYECDGSCGDNTKPNSCNNAGVVGRLVK